MTDLNKPDSNEALRPWLLMDRLTLYQAVMLIFGRDPSHKLTSRPNGFVPMMAALREAIQRGEVSAQDANNPTKALFFSDDVEHNSLVRQSDVRDWLETIGHRSAFFYFVKPDAWPGECEATSRSVCDADRPLEARERSTLLCIIGALAKNAKLDISTPMKAGDAIAAMMPEVKISGRSIGEHLKAVREAMDSRKK